MKLDITFWKKWCSIGHEGLVDAVRSSSSHLYTSKEGCLTPHQQSIALRVTHHPITCAEAVTEISCISWNLIVVFGRNDMVWTIRGFYMLSEAPQPILIHPRKGMKQSSSNVCLSLQCSNQFFHSERVPNIWYFAWNWDWFSSEMTWYWPPGARICWWKLLQFSLHICKIMTRWYINLYLLL